MLFINAYLAAILASIASGLIGSYVVVKRIAFLSGSIAHAVLGGIGLCLYLERVHDITWATPLLGATLSAILAALAIGWIRLKSKEREDTAIAALWSFGMAFGIIFISLTPGYNVELTNYLVGNILWVSKTDLYLLASLDLLILVTVTLNHKRFLALCFDENQAKLQGLSTNLLYLLLLTLIALTIVLLIQSVGILLVITLLAIPPAIASRFTRCLSTMMILSVILTLALTLGGLALSHPLEWPPGATIALLTAAIYLLEKVGNRKT